jgi:hypothetical protein
MSARFKNFFAEVGGFFGRLFEGEKVTTDTLIMNGDTATSFGDAQTIIEGIEFDSLSATKFIGDSIEGSTRIDAIDNIITPPHAWARFADSTETIALTEDVWAQVTNASDSLFRVLELVGGFTVEADTFFTPTIRGHYNISCALSFESGVADVMQIRLMTDEGELNKMTWENGSAGAIQSVPLDGYCKVDGDGTDKLWIEVQNTTDNDDVDALSGFITIQYFHPIPQ